MAPAVSIVVPVYGTEEHLGDCIGSLLRQTVADFEVIVVDDCSPGDPAAVVGRVAHDDPRVRVVRHDQNRGVMQARFTGADAATGAYLAFVDSDDEVEPWYLEMLHGAATRFDADLVQCALLMRAHNVRVVNRGGDDHQLSGDGVLHGLLAGEMSNMLGNKLIRAGVWQRAVEPLKQLPGRVSFSQDLLCLFHVAMRSATYAHIPDPCYRYFRRPSSVTMAAASAPLLRNLEGLGRTFEVIRDVLGARREPADLVRTFFEREFLLVVQDLMRRLAGCDDVGPAGFPPSPDVLGLMGAVTAVSVGAGTGEE